ncbi:MAG TPA: hypothetical protein PLQ67_00375 [Burkholderiaceae bacterium]|nr:hypothetical protein [Burkholderiaceae bacterium]
MSRIHLVKRLGQLSSHAEHLLPDTPLALPAPEALQASAQPNCQPDAAPAANEKRQPRQSQHSGCLSTSPVKTQDLYVWFEDTSARVYSSRRGIAGLPESLLPYARGLRVVERQYVEGHLHLLAAVHLRCTEHFGERVSALYTAALSVGTVAWIGTGEQYARAWQEMYS